MEKDTEKDVELEIEKGIEIGEKLNFSSRAQDWDTPDRISRAKDVVNAMKEALQLSSEKPLKKGLEFGCGTGLVGFSLKDEIQALSLVDISQGMIAMVDKKAVELSLPHVKGYCADLMSEDFERQDLIFTSMALHHIPDLEPLLERFSQLTQIGGRLCIVDLDLDHKGLFHSEEEGFDGHDGFDQQALSEELKKYGFKTTVSHTFFKAEKIKNNKRVPYSLFVLVAEKL